MSRIDSIEKAYEQFSRVETGTINAICAIAAQKLWHAVSTPGEESAVYFLHQFIQKSGYIIDRKQHPDEHFRAYMKDIPLFWAALREARRFWLGQYHPIPVKLRALETANLLKHLDGHPIQDEIDGIRGSQAEEAQLVYLMTGNVYAFPHASTNGKGMVAYTPNAEMFAQDRQIATRVGKMLTACGQLPQAFITHFAGYYNNYSPGNAQVEILRTGDDIEWAYKNGPGSCMGKSADNFRSYVHPVRAYESPDFGLAIIRDADNGERVVARAVVRVDKQQYYRVYGNEALMHSALGELGYIRDSGFAYQGRLAALYDTSKDEFVGPYIDGDDHEIYTIEGDKEFLRIGYDKDNGHQIGNTTNSHESGGFLGPCEPEYECEGCGCSCDELYGVYYRGRMIDVCESCRDECYVVATNVHGDRCYVHENAVVTTADHSTFTSNDAAEAAGYMLVDDEWYHEDALVFSECGDEYLHKDDATRIKTPGGATDWARDGSTFFSDKDDTHISEVCGRVTMAIYVSTENDTPELRQTYQYTQNCTFFAGLNAWIADEDLEDYIFITDDLGNVVLVPTAADVIDTPQPDTAPSGALQTEQYA